MKYNICVDLNGVLDTYTGWKDDNHQDPPRPGAKEFLQQLQKQYRVILFTTRPAEKVWAWLKEYGLSEWVDEVTDRKPPAMAYIDDRAICFDGDFEATLMELKRFRPHWQEPEHTLNKTLKLTRQEALLMEELILKALQENEETMKKMDARLEEYPDGIVNRDLYIVQYARREQENLKEDRAMLKKLWKKVNGTIY